MTIVTDKPPYSVEDHIVDYYRQAVPKKVHPPLDIPDGAVLSSYCQGLGDTVILTDVPRSSKGKQKIFSVSPHFLPLMTFNPYWSEQMDKAIMVNCCDLVRNYATGNGHYIQRLQRAFGLKVQDVPRGCIETAVRRDPNKVVMHFDPGKHVLWQRQQVHPKARFLYPQTKAQIERFIRERPDLSFMQLGNRENTVAGATTFTTDSTIQLINAIAGASWFIGIISGPMHVATALGLKCIVIVNFPYAHKIVLPTLVVTGQVEEEWFYPQNVHLHQEGEAILVKRATAENLHRAMNGEIYPFWKTDYCSLIHDWI